MVNRKFHYTYISPLTSNRQPWTPGQKLYKHPLFFPIVRTEHLEQEPNRPGIGRVSVIRPAAFHQRLDVPSGYGIPWTSTENCFQLFRMEHPQILDGEHRLESLSQGFHLTVDSLHQVPVGHQVRVLVEVLDGHVGETTVFDQFHVVTR